MDERRPPPPREPNADPGLAEAVERVGGRIANAIVIAAMIIGLVVYLRPGPPRYQVSADEGRIVRVDTRRGTVISCEDGRCSRILRRGQRFERGAEPDEEKETEPARQVPPPPQAPAPNAPAASPAVDTPAQPTRR